MRSLDKQGSGNVGRTGLLAHLKSLGLGERKRRRWLADALDLGLMTEIRRWTGVVVYKLAGLAKAAVLVDCTHLGEAAGLTSADLIKTGWHGPVWACYNATLHEQPVSQKVKAAMTGVDERTQRNYQRSAPGEARRNFAFTRLSPEQVPGRSRGTRSSLFALGK